MKILAFRTKLACLEPQVPISFLDSKCQIQPRINPLSLPSQPFKVSLSILKRYITWVFFQQHGILE